MQPDLDEATVDSPRSAEFYQRKADEMRGFAASEAVPAIREQHLRIAAMYQSLADQTMSRPTVRMADSRTRIAIPKGLLRQT